MKLLIGITKSLEHLRYIFSQKEGFEVKYFLLEQEHPVELFDWCEAFCIISNAVDSSLLEQVQQSCTQKHIKKILAPVLSKDVWLSESTQNSVKDFMQEGYAVVDYACGYFDAFNLDFEIFAALDSTKFTFRTVPLFPHPGSFGIKRRYHYHTGVDLYVHRNNAVVVPFEDGEIVSYGHFTGTFCNSPWWNNTHYIAVKSGDKVFVYGELVLDQTFIDADGKILKTHIGEKVTTSTILGTIIPVTKERRIEYPYHNNKMLHFEMYDAKTFVDAAVDEWEIDKKQPGSLLDPTEYALRLLKK